MRISFCAAVTALTALLALVVGTGGMSTALADVAPPVSATPVSATPVSGAISATPAAGTGGTSAAPSGSARTSVAPPPAGATPIPLLAYFYQWFDAAQWNRVKIDYPAVGKYDSSDTSVMRHQIEQAKHAGIDGFIVSWKDTPLDDARLTALVSVATDENFKLSVIYQGLDFSRNPLTTPRVAEDFLTFQNTYASNPVFVRLGGKPLLIWSGTWEFTHNQVETAVGPVRSALTVLNTEKDVAGYRRLADITDGTAYYWSSVNPDTNPTWQSKLQQLSAAAHADGHYWIAPFAPGFNAKAVGGTSTVDRKDGATLRAEYATAVRSSPDILGLISWNEFSENTYIEPSVNFGSRYLDVMTELRHASLPAIPAAVDSSDSALGPGSWRNLLVAGSIPLALFAAVTWFAVWRRRRRPAMGPESPAMST